MEPWGFLKGLKELFESSNAGVRQAVVWVWGETPDQFREELKSAFQDADAKVQWLVRLFISS